MSAELVFETHSLSEDNEAGLATGWLPGRLSARGRDLARELGDRHRDEAVGVVLCSDLRRASETAEIAFAGRDDVPVLLDWRLRECDYGVLNGEMADTVHAAVDGLDDHYPGGESWREAVARCGEALADLDRRWPDGRVLVIGHMATYWAVQHRYAGLPLDRMRSAFVWQEGWRLTRENG